jgi:hypothetical protein
MMSNVMLIGILLNVHIKLSFISSKKLMVGNMNRVQTTSLFHLSDGDKDRYLLQLILLNALHVKNGVLFQKKEKYEELHARIKEDLFTCEKACEWKLDVTCNDPSDVSKDSSWLWAMDQHNIPQPPPGFERLIAIRGEGGTKFADV